ncbi:MAG: 4Fe-4S cluster-binding domain-containing protein, partial [candidate division WOR-3 bacterium]|nr:4Fe-4S cluster-binding domain-containing protein [candidate division WOR-3 bacterium]
MGDRSDIKISINNIVYPVNSLGPGTRIGIWVQGCSMECKRCMAKHTWNINEGKRYKIYQLTNRIEVYKNL